MAIANDFIIDAVNQRIYHNPAGDEPERVWSLNNLYTYFTLTFDDDLQMDDLPPMSAQTPTAFTMENSWFIDPISLRFLNGGSLTTSGWNATTYDNGIRPLTFSATYTDAVVGDIGKPVVGSTTGSTGTLLYYDNTLKKWWVRTDDTGDTFNQAESITITGGTGTGTTSSASTTGENTWANIFTLGTIADNTQIYLYQNGTQITPWWTTDHIDILVLVRESNLLIDSGYVTIFARQYTKLYDNYVADLASGARTPIPLATFKDTANLTGYRSSTGSSGSGTFEALEIIQKTGDSTVQGIVTAVSGTTTDPVIAYYLFKYPLTDFQNGDSIDGLTSGANCTAGAPSDVGPASLSGITFTFGATEQDLNNGYGTAPYDCIIDCNNYPLASVYEYVKLITRYGETTTLNGNPGEAYTAVGDIRLPYTAQSGDFTEGLTVTSAGGATGVIVADHDDGTTGTLILRNVTGTFVATEAITDTSTGTATAGTPETISPTKQSPFGTFAGGKFFGAQGVWLDNVPSYDANNFELIDSTNTPQLPPQTIMVTVTGVVAEDQVGVFRTTGDNDIIDKSVYTSHATNNLTDATTFTVQEAIASDTPDNGYIRCVKRDASGNAIDEDRYQYQSWFGNTFTLSGGVTLLRDFDGQDTAYVPYIDDAASSTTIDVEITYTANRYVLTRVRKKGIIPFTVTGQITSAGLTVTAIRTADTIQT